MTRTLCGLIRRMHSTGDSRLALIAGAGIGGLAAGVALQRAGWRVRIFERASHVRELGFALLLAPNAVVSLEQLGLAERVIAQGVEVAEGEIRGTAGRLLRRFDVGAIKHLLPQSPIVALRSTLYGALLDSVGIDNLSLASEVNALSVRDGRPLVSLASGESVAGDVLIGADGVGSVIRRILHPAEGPLRPSGLWAVRGVVHDIESVMSGFPGGQYFGSGVEAGVSRAGAGAVYWYLSVPATQLPASRDAQAIAQRCADQFDDRLRRIVSATKAGDMRLDELFDRDPIAEWGRGPVTLLGDAAHPMLPHAGQGAAQALEDAVAIGRVLNGTGDIDPALRRYERVRAQRTREIARIARINARVGSISNSVGRHVRDLVIRLVPDSVFTKAYVQFGNPPAVE